jgi:ribonuclease HI
MEKCKSCGTSLIIKQTKRTPEQLLKSYYYTAYYLCPNCHKLYHNDKFKVENTNLFTPPVVEVKDIDVEIWTDGACSNNGRPNAKASWAFVSGEYEGAGLVEGKQTNNPGEGFAILYALRWAVSNGHKTIKISSDSQISLNNLKKPAFMVKENRELFQEIENLIKENELTVVYEKVAGHADNVNNNRADKLANGLVGLK